MRQDRNQILEIDLQQLFKSYNNSGGYFLNSTGGMRYANYAEEITDKNSQSYSLSQKIGEGSKLSYVHKERQESRINSNIFYNGESNSFSTFADKDTNDKIQTLSFTSGGLSITYNFTDNLNYIADSVSMSYGKRMFSIKDFQKMNLDTDIIFTYNTEGEGDIEIINDVYTKPTATTSTGMKFNYKHFIGKATVSNIELIDSYLRTEIYSSGTGNGNAKTYLAIEDYKFKLDDIADQKRTFYGAKLEF
ncbi:hypothetical protein CPAV1605_264 [seawater metagenome]|uniref:Uncharacterized protein n=1 Tax=seawater metagenome TaxID=1561972 RepID=A0A5E8CIU0_9ZZZZ